MPLSGRAVETRCDACLGNRQCWVCLGQGRIERPDGGFAACVRCSGTGRCSYCSGETQRESSRVTPQVIHLDQPQATSFS